MRNKKLIISLKTGLMILVVGLLSYSFSAAQTTFADNCAEIATSKVRSDGGLLTIVDDTDAGYYSDPASADPNSRCLYSPKLNVQVTSTYRDMVTKHYDRAKPSIQKQPPMVGDTFQNTSGNNPLKLHGNERLFKISNGDLFMNNQNIKTAGPNKAKAIFVDGSLYIDEDLGNIVGSDAGLVFVVQGDVYIDKDVRIVNAFIITFGKFCSVYNKSDITPVCLSDTDVAGVDDLTINGSVISLGSIPPEFNRNVGSTDPSEIINYQPKYLAIFHDIFAGDTTHWSEIE